MPNLLISARSASRSGLCSSLCSGLSLAALSSLVFLLAAPVLADNYYKWIDDNGMTHYGEHPPKGANIIKKGKTQTGHSQATTYTGAATSPTKTVANSDTSKKNSEADTAASQKDPERCTSAQSNLEAMRTHSRIKVKDKNGEYRFLTPEEIQDRQGEAQKAADESC